MWLRWVLPPQGIGVAMSTAIVLVVWLCSKASTHSATLEECLGGCSHPCDLRLHRAGEGRVSRGRWLPSPHSQHKEEVWPRWSRGTHWNGMELRAQTNLLQIRTQTTFSSSFQKKNLRHEEEIQQLAMYQGVTARFRLDLSLESSLPSKATQAHVTQRSQPPVLSHCCQCQALSCPIPCSSHKQWL